LKETVIPAGSNKIIFVFAPILTFILSLMSWYVIPFFKTIVYMDINIGILYLLAISSLMFMELLELGGLVIQNMLC